MEIKRINNLFKGDRTLWMVFFLLCMISIIEVYSASSSLSYKGGDFWSPILKHAGLLFVGTIAAICVMNVPCKFFKLATPLLLAVSFITLIWVLLAGETTNGANRWVSFLGIQFQPSEIAKGTLVLTVAQILSYMQNDDGADPTSFKYIMIVSAVLIIPIALENLSTAMLLAITIFCMMLIGRVPGRLLGKLVGIVVIAAVLLFAVVMVFGQTEEPTTAKQNLTEQTAQEPKEEKGIVSKLFHRAGTWKGRVLKFANHEEVPPEKVDLDEDAQVVHANIAVASSNIVGKGPGNSTERDFLSQAFSDFIYAIIIEEMGIEGAFIVALLYITILFRASIIARRCENNFPAFLVMGLALLLVTQALFNMMVAVGLVPVTGQPLPLVSKGGTSTIINCVYIGAMLSISRTAKKRNTGNEAAAVAADVQQERNVEKD